jgi:hypothetical protein
MSESNSSTRELFYTNVPHMDSLVFAPPKVAEYVSAIHNALRSTTWGEFKTLMPLEEFERLVQRAHSEESDLDEDGFEPAKLPSDDDKFEPEFWFPEWCDGDYPEWLQTRQNIWLPDTILERFACINTSVINGDFWLIDPVFEKDIVEALRCEGFDVTRRDDLFFY